MSSPVVVFIGHKEEIINNDAILQIGHNNSLRCYNNNSVVNILTASFAAPTTIFACFVIVMYII